MTDQVSSRERSDLLAYALFDADDRVGNARHNLLAFLICLAIFELGRPASREEILSVLRARFLPNDGVVLNQVEVVVAASRRAGLLKDGKGGTIDLQPQRKEQLIQAAKRINTLRDSFYGEIFLSIEEEIREGLSGNLKKELRAILDGFIHRLFQEESVALARAFGKDGKGLDGTITDQMRPESIESLLRASTEPIEKFRRKQITRGLREGLLELGPTGQRYLATVYQKTVAFSLLQQDPSIRKVKRELAQRRVFYLDTNVIMAFLFSADSKHEQVKTAIDAAQQVGCELVVSSITINELEAQLEKSNKRYEGLKSYEDKFSIFDDVILRTYTSHLKGNPRYSWQTFLAGYLPVEEALTEVGIKTDDADVDIAQFDERLDPAREHVAREKPPYVGRRVIEADAKNLILIQLRRKKLKGDEMGRRVWLITLDHSLKYAERRLIARKYYEVPSSKYLSNWASGLTPHLSPEDEDLGEYALRVVQSHLQLLAEDPVFADIDFLVTLDQSPIDIDDLMAANPKKTRRILIALQERREIEEILEEQPNEPAERDAWALRLTEIVQEALRKLDENAEKRAAIEAVASERDEARGEAHLLKKDLDEANQRVSDLEGNRRWLTRFWKRG